MSVGFDKIKKYNLVILKLIKKLQKLIFVIQEICITFSNQNSTNYQVFLIIL